MTDELENIEEWNFPEQYRQALEQYDINTPEFNIVQGRLYEQLRVDDRYTPEEALMVSTKLNQGKVDGAFSLVYDQLEGEEQ